jgi:hypothetical protein
VAGGEVRADRGDDHVGTPDRLSDQGRIEGVRGNEALCLGGRRGGRRCPVDAADVVAALSGQGDNVAADAAGGPEDGDVHGGDRQRDQPPHWTDQYSLEASRKWTT